jgi:hypothetical protein
MDNGWAQEFEASDYYRPEFEDRDRPFKGGADNDDPGTREEEKTEGGKAQ